MYMYCNVDEMCLLIMCLIVKIEDWFLVVCKKKLRLYYIKGVCWFFEVVYL